MSPQLRGEHALKRLALGCNRRKALLEARLGGGIALGGLLDGGPEPDRGGWDYCAMPISPHFNNPEHWRDRAEEARVLANRMVHPRNREVMLQVAEDYDQLAVRAAQRLLDEEK